MKGKRYMEITHITSSHPLYSSRILMKQCKSLAQAEFKVNLVVQHEREEVLEGVKICALAKTSKRWVRLLVRSYQAYRKALKIPSDIYHIHDPELLIYAWLLKVKGKRVVYDVHEDYTSTLSSKPWLPGVLRHKIADAFGRFELFVSKKLDLLVCATPHIANKFIPHLQHVITVRNFVNLDEFFETGQASEQSENAVCYVGNISKARGIEEIVAALPLTKANLYLAGEVHSDMLSQKLKALPGWQQVTALGHIPREKAFELMRGCVVGLIMFHPIANHTNALPNKMFEYMAAGIPIIMSNFPDWEKMVKQYQCGMCVDPLNPEAIAVAINWFIEHPKEAKQLGKNGRKAVEQHYNWQAEKGILISGYENIMTKSKGVIGISENG